MFHHFGVNRIDAVAVGLNLCDVEIVEGVVAQCEYHFYHIAHVRIDLNNGGSEDFNGFCEGLLGEESIEGE